MTERLVHSDKLKAAFRRASGQLNVSAEDMTPVEVALLDLIDAFREIYEDIVPALERMGGNGSIDSTEFLNLMVDLRVALRHIEWHLSEAVPKLEKLMQLPSHPDSD